MKKLLRNTILCGSLFITTCAQSSVIADTTATVMVDQTQSKEVALNNRLSEINAMDKSQLTREEKHNLRMEVKSIDKEMRDGGGSGGLYISAGAVIVILLLLIILL